MNNTIFKVPVGSVHRCSVEMKRAFLLTLGNGPTSPLMEGVMSMNVWMFHGVFESTAQRPCSPIVAYTIPSVLRSMPSIVQMDQLKFRENKRLPQVTQIKHWKCRDSNPGQPTLRSGLFFATPNNWHKQRFMC